MSARKGARRRTPGTGSVWEYRTKAGEVRYAIGYTAEQPDGSTRSVTRRTGPHGEKWTTRKAATDALEDVRSAIRKGGHVDPSKQQLGKYLEEWLDGLRLAPGSVASYRKNVRLHMTPYLGTVQLSSLTTARINTLYRQLERGGRADYRKGEGLSPRTVRYVHTILSAALSDAVKSNRLARNPASSATPPTEKEARAPEMHPWNAAQLAAFLRWSAGNSPFHVLWYVLAFTGARRGEALALRWRDVDLDAGTASIRRSAGLVRVKGEAARITEGSTKTGKARVIDLDTETVALLRSHRRARAAMALQLGRDDALVFGDHEGGYLNPEGASHKFRVAVRQCQKALGDEAVPGIRLHDLRHTHASLLLADGEPVKVVSERLGHSSAMITLNVYQAVMPGMQRRAAERFASLVKGTGA